MRTPLATVLGAAAVPYGVTLVVASETLILRHFHGGPSLAEIFCFVFSTVAGYFVLALSLRPQSLELAPAPLSAMMRAGALHFIAVGVSLLVVTGLAELPGAIAWPLVGASGLPTYFAIAAGQYRFVESR